MACERTHVDDTSYRRLVVKEKEAHGERLCDQHRARCARSHDQEGPGIRFGGPH